MSAAILPVSLTSDVQLPYLILRSADPQDLEQQVNDHILKFGYVPIGGLVEGNLFQDEQGILHKTCMQAMYRRLP